MIENAVTSRKDGEWATVGKTNLDELKSQIITVGKLKPQHDINEDTYASMKTIFSKQIQSMAGIQLRAMSSYEKRRKAAGTGTKGQKKGSSGAANSNGVVAGGRSGRGRGNGGGRGRGNSNRGRGSSGNASIGPHNPSDAAKLVHPDNKVKEEAYRLLKELKPDGVPKLTTTDARTAFKGIKFYNNIFEKRSGTDKLYDKINWGSWKNKPADATCATRQSG